MKKIRITITMTEQEAEWLEQACFVEEEFPHSKFLNRVSNLARRARHAFQKPRATDGQTVPVPNDEPDIQELIDDKIVDILACR